MWLLILRAIIFIRVSEVAMEQFNYYGPTRNLTEYLLRVHNKKVAPEGQLQLTYKVQFGQVLQVNEVAQCIAFLLYIEQRWIDPSLSWNPKDFGGLEEVWLPQQDIWQPDIIVTNIADVKYIMEEVRLPVYISNVGHVTYAYPIKYDVTCPIDIENFPFDSQDCSLSINTWAYSAGKLNITPIDSDILQLYQENDEWEMQYERIRVVMTEYWGLPWKNIFYHFTLKRRALFYIITLFLPSALITVVAIIGLFAPSSSSGERTEKVTMGITTMLTMAIFLMMVAEQMPKTSTVVPLIGVYFLFQIGAITCATIVTVIIMSVHRRARNKTPPPKYLRQVFIVWPHKFARLFQGPCPCFICLKRCRDRRRQTQSLPNAIKRNAPLSRSTRQLQDDLSLILQQTNKALTNNENNNLLHSGVTPRLERLNTNIQVVLNELRDLRRRSVTQTHQPTPGDWVEIAAAFDKIAMVLTLSTVLAYYTGMTIREMT